MLKKRKKMLKTDFPEKLRTFSEELKSLGALFDCGFAWHFADSDLLMNVLPEQGEHRHPYCRMMKGNPYRKLNLCIRFHHDESFRELRTGSGFRIAECHAGVKTLAVAMTLAGELKGVLFAGPFAGGRSHSLPFGTAAADSAGVLGPEDSLCGAFYAEMLLRGADGKADRGNVRTERLPLSASVPLGDGVLVQRLAPAPACRQSLPPS